MNNRIVKFILLLCSYGLLLANLGACSSVKYVGEGEYLLVKNKLSFKDSVKVKIGEDDFQNEIRPLPNKNVFFMPLFLYIYNWSSPKNRGIDRWLRKVGEPPVILDSLLLDVSQRRLLARAQYCGYNNARVVFDVKTRKKKARVFYNVILGRPHKIRNIHYEFENPTIDSTTIETQNSLLKPKNLLEHAKCELEADRIVEKMRNKSYFNFDKTCIKFLIDTTMGNYLADITVKIIDDTSRHDLYYKYYIRNITINPYLNYTEHYPKGDTLSQQLVHEKCNIVYIGKKPYIRPSVLKAKTFFELNHPYRENQEQRTYSNFASLAIIRSLKIDCTKPDSAESKMIDSVVFRPLDVNIGVNNAKRSLGNIGGDVSITSDGLFGVRVYGEYQHRNLFGGGELFAIGSNVAFRKVRIIKDGPALNSVEYAGYTSLTFPKFLLPIDTRKFSKIKAPTTRLSLSVDYQNRVDYERIVGKVGLTYGWRIGEFMSFRFSPVDLNLTNVKKVDELFWKSIENNPYLQSSYQNQIELGLSTTFSHTDRFPASKYYNYFSIKVDLKGNLLYLASSLFAQKTVDESNQEYYTIFDTRYAQYFQTNVNYAFAKPINDYTTIAFNTFCGVGIPYGNALSLPIEKMYYAGGSNSLRGWQLRTVGPGTYVSPDKFLLNNLGEFKLEINAEYRFRLAGEMLEGALFMDAGNIWTIQPNDPRQGAHLFKDGQFFKSIALNTGLGFRVLIMFFVFRVDWGLQLYSPVTQKIVEPKNWFDGQSAVHITINYPF